MLLEFVLAVRYIWLRFGSGVPQRSKLYEISQYLTPVKVWGGVGELYKSKRSLIIGVSDFRYLAYF